MEQKIEDGKFIFLLNTLNKNDLRRLKKFSNSDFVNKNLDVKQFLEYFFLQNAAENHILDKVAVHHFLYENHPYNDLRIRHLMSMATDILEDFLVYQTIQKKKILKEKILLNQYIEWNVEKYIQSTTAQIQKLYQETGVLDADYYLSQYQMMVNLYHLQSSNIRTKDFDFQETVHHLTTFSIIEILKSACTVNTINKVMETKIEQPLLSSILEVLPDSRYLSEPLVFIYYHLYLLVENDDEAVLQSLLSNIQKNEHLFSHRDLNTLYRTIINFCIRKSNQNKVEYTKMAFDIYQYAIEQGALIEHHEINRFIFTNVITLGIKLNELDQCLDFLKKYEQNIHPNFRLNTVDYNLAKIYYAQKQLDQSLKILLTNEFKDKIWNLNSKFLILKILFEQNDLDTFKQQLNAFKTYVKRIQNIGYHKTYFENVIKALTALLGKKSGKKKYLNHIFDQNTPDFEWFSKWK